MKGTNNTPASVRYLAQMHDALQKAEAATTPYMIRMYEKRAADFAGKFSKIFREELAH